MLCDQICQPLTEHLSSQYPGQIVQILTNLEHFERACIELQKELAEQRKARRSGGSVTLAATEQFRSARRKAEKRIFELVKSKIDDLTETAEYDWYVSQPSHLHPCPHTTRRHLLTNFVPTGNQHIPPQNPAST